MTDSLYRRLTPSPFTSHPSPLTPSPLSPSPLTLHLSAPHPSPLTPSPLTPSPLSPSPPHLSPFTSQPLTLHLSPPHPSPPHLSPFTPSPPHPSPFTSQPLTPSPPHPSPKGQAEPDGEQHQSCAQVTQREQLNGGVEDLGGRWRVQRSTLHLSTGLANSHINADYFIAGYIIGCHRRKWPPPLGCHFAISLQLWAIQTPAHMASSLGLSSHTSPPLGRCGVH